MSARLKMAAPALLLAGWATAGWLETIDTITSRTVSDYTCQGNAHAVVEDAFGNIHVVWRGEDAGLQQVWYSRLGVETDTWTTDTVISGNGPAVTDPAIAADSAGYILVVWTSGASLRARRRLGATGEWEGIDSAAGSSGDSSVSVAFDASGTAHIVWHRPVSTNQLVLHAECDTTISARLDTVAGPSTNLGRASIAAAPNGDLMVAWERFAPTYDVVARRRAAGLWQNSEVVFGAYRSRHPNAAFAQDSFHVVWVAEPSNQQAVLHRARGANGWGDTTRLSPYWRTKKSPSLAVASDGSLYAAWAGSDLGTYQIYWTRRPPGGVWQASDTLTSRGAASKERASVSAGTGTVQVVWSEEPQTFRWQVRMRRYYEQEHDVGVLRVGQPVGIVDSGAHIAPAAWIRNWGNVTEHLVRVSIRIGGETLAAGVDSLAAGDSARVVFGEWQARVLGRLSVRCSTSVFRDMNRGNDTLSSTVFVRLRDVMAESIIAPVGEIESLSVVPRLVVRNRGNVPDSFECRCWIDSDSATVYYDSTRAVVDSAASRTVAMRPWLTQPGEFTVRFEVRADGDRHPDNDTISHGFSVVRHDVGVIRLAWPTGRVDSGAVGTPRAVVKNFGSRPESFGVVCRIGSLYADTASVPELAPGDTAEVVFAEWQAEERGFHAVVCSTLLRSDRVDSNNCRRDSVWVIVRDAACTRIVRPVEVVSRGQLQPEARFQNRGTDTAGMWCWFEIVREEGLPDGACLERSRMARSDKAGHFDRRSARLEWRNPSPDRNEYLDSTWLELAPAAESAVEFSTWPAHSGRYLSRAWSGLDRDMQSDNDTATHGFFVSRIDAALEEIVAPASRIEARAVVPRIRIANLSEEAADVRVSCRALAGDTATAYSGSAVAPALPETTETIVDLPAWNALPGTYRFIARTELPGDSNPYNDAETIAVVVESVPFGRWTEIASIPAGPRGVPVRGGGGLVATIRGIYALKGSNTDEWSRYCAEADSWQIMAPVPAGTDGRRVGRGAALAASGDSVFLLRGMRTHDFLVYLASRDSWLAARSLPEYTSGIRFGSGLAFVPARDTGKVFCLRGGGTRDFLVYWCRQRQWHARRSVPPGQTGRGVRRGSALIALGSRVFCLLGVTNELHEYFPKGDSWVQRRSLPLVNRHGHLKRSRAGAGLTADGSRFIYALKGGGCNEFWRYDAVADNWTQLDGVPFGRDRRRVKAGAGLAVWDGSVWAMKGGGSNEAWRYQPEAALAPPPRPARTGVAAPEERTDELRAAATLAEELELPADVVEVRVRDAVGRLVRRQVGAARIRGLAPGVYFVEWRSAAGRRTFKLQVLP